MSKILTGSKIQLSRGFSDGESTVTQEKYMSLTTEREVLIKRRKVALKTMNTHRDTKDKRGRGAFNAARDEFEKVTRRLKRVNATAKQQADISQLILNRLKQYVPKDDWMAIVRMARIEQEQILAEVSGWE